MVKNLMFVVVVASLLFSTTALFAQEPGIGTKDDNACNEGGNMAGKCDTSWEWMCGWYLARWEARGGWFYTSNPFNDQCLTVLPPQPIDEFGELISLPITHCLEEINIWCFTGNSGTLTLADGTPAANILILPPGSPCPPPYDDNIGTVADYTGDQVEALLNSLGFGSGDRMCLQILNGG